MIVVDSNVLTYLLIDGEFTPQAQGVYRKDPMWVMPLLWIHELVNVLTTYLRVERMTLDAAAGLLKNAELLLADRPREPDYRRTLQKAAEYRISGYDAQYVVLAEMFAVPLITEDRALLKAVPQGVMSMKQFLGNVA